MLGMVWGGDAEDTLNKRLKELLEATPSQAVAQDPHKKVRDAYKACMDTERIKNMSFVPLIETFGILGVWADGPLHKLDWVPSGGIRATESWYNMISEMRKKGLSISKNLFIQFKVDMDCEDTSKYKIFLDQPDLLMPQHILVLGDTNNNPLIGEYQKLMGGF